MKYLATLVGAAIWLLTSTTVQAQEKKFTYNPLQIQAVVSGDFEVDKSLKLIAQTTYLTVPDSNVHLGFSYFGIRGQLGKYVWMAASIGVAHNWRGGWPMISSIWMGADIYKQYLTVFAMVDLYLVVRAEEVDFNKPLRDFYGYYSVDSQFLKWMSAGFHVEHVNKDATFGAHVMFNYKVFSFGLEHHIGVQEAVRGHSFRLVTKVHFSGS